jgi:hypothetical protein
MAMGFVQSAPLQWPCCIHTPEPAPVGDLLRRLQTFEPGSTFFRKRFGSPRAWSDFQNGSQLSSPSLVSWVHSKRSWPYFSRLSGQERSNTRAHRTHSLVRRESSRVKCERSEVRGQSSVLDARLPVAQEEICFLFFTFYYYYLSRSSRVCTHLSLITISPPDLRQQKRNRLESQNHSSAPCGGTSYACPYFFHKS